MYLALFLAGCRPAQQAVSVSDGYASEKADPANEARGIADAVLGKQSEILTQGDLAQNGREQLLVVNRISKGVAGGEGEDPSSIFITRAAILEKNDGKLSEILRCDEHLKNPNGYLGGSPSARISGWWLEYSKDEKKGLEMRFTPAEGAAGEQGSGANKAARTTIVVRWNTGLKRYQSYDRLRQKYMPEPPALNAEPSILK